MLHSHRIRVRLFITALLSLSLGTVSTRAQNSSPRPPDKPQPKQTTNAASARTGSITGRIITDGGQPLSDATVFAIAINGQNSPHTAGTDADGRFRITDLSTAVYTISASLPGYVVAPDVFVTADSGAEENRYYHLGDDATLTMIKGGVITGKVWNAAGEPVVGARLQAILVRDANNRLSPSSGYLYQSARQTDDRGVYRLYGLAPGTYIVSVGGTVPSFMGYRLTAYDGDAPTFYPSVATRDTASEITVRGGEEASGVDIRYRSEHGRTVSGTITNVPAVKSGFSSVNITLYYAANKMPAAYTFIAGDTDKAFAFDGVADGEYDLIAQINSGSKTDQGARSSPVRISVRGANVSGLKLTLQLLGSISGRVRLVEEPKPSCAANKRPPASPTETVLNARRDEKELAKQSAPLAAPFGNVAAPRDDGDFTIRNLEAGTYRLQVRTPNETWYVASIESNTPAVKDSDGKLALRSGEQKEGLTITLANGGAQLAGHVVAATGETRRLPAQLRVYLVPVEPERADDALRYAGTRIDADGAFAFASIAPGRYKLVARAEEAAQEIDSSTRLDSTKQTLQDAAKRAALRRMSDAPESSAITTLQPCQSITDITLSYPARASTTDKSAAKD